ncbi:MAG: biotin--[Alphaproteobacteria bacterium]|nr:biotin--[acetyl-CoA-carboxylase] ligase [Alphaproteobacteria bacterium]
MKWKKFAFEVVDSTNKVAVDYSIGSVIVAETQTNGRGRYGHTWVSDKGNLYLSAVLKTYGTQTPLLAFVIAVAVAETLSEFGVVVQLKWPNDVLLDGGKLAGILLEQSDEKLIVGIGINCVSCPVGLPYPAVHLNGKVSIVELQTLILQQLDKWICLFEKNGFLSIYHKWKEYAIGIGKNIVVRLPNETLTGIFRDLSESGALILELPDNTVKYVTAGVVFFENERNEYE